jgi:LAS superfamily LD-carboxypeptidase LdcB
MSRRVAIFALATMVLVAAPGPSEAGAGVDRPSDIPVHRYAADPAADLATLQARVDEAVRVVEEAEGQLRASVAEEQKIAGEIERIDDELKRIAVNEYMDGGAVRSSSLEITSDPHDGVQRQALVDAVAGDRVALLDEQRSAKEKLLEVRPQVEEAIERAKVHRGEMETQLASLKDAQARQAEADRVAAEQQQRQAASRPPTTATQASGGRVDVRGIIVDASIGQQLANLLSEADAAGLNLGGGGYRDPAAQRRLREANCPNPVSSPASACSPPTAKPGSSMHEQGLAIDFTNDGSLIQSRSSAAFKWLAANAERFGFHNLPSEPWHFSVNGN